MDSPACKQTDNVTLNKEKVVLNFSKFPETAAVFYWHWKIDLAKAQYIFRNNLLFP